MQMKLVDAFKIVCVPNPISSNTERIGVYSSKVEANRRADWFRKRFPDSTITVRKFSTWSVDLDHMINHLQVERAHHGEGHKCVGLSVAPSGALDFACYDTGEILAEFVR